MKTPFFALAALAVLVFQSGCTEASYNDSSEDESVGVSEDALLSDNALSPNALSPNALSPNALASITSNSTEGANARALVKYTVGCALDSSQSFAFSWTDSTGTAHNEVFQGLLGIAPTWASSPLSDVKKQGLVSACIAARVNYYGVTVMISMRSVEDPLKTLTGSQELADYSHIEGAFWGNLFTQTPYLNSCYNAANVTNSRNAQRDCAVGHLDNGQVVPCGMIKLQGSCSNWCQNINGAGQYYPSCVEQPGVPNSPMTKSVATTALP